MRGSNRYVICDLCETIVYVWPRDLRAESFDDAAEAIRRHLREAHATDLKPPA